MNYLINLLKKYKTFQDMKLAIPKIYPFVMHQDEKELFKKYIQKSHNYLEFGLGGSTIFSLINSKCAIYCVDSNQQWLDFMNKYAIIKEHSTNRLRIFLEDIGPTKDWGYPVDDSHKELFPNFSKNVFDQIPIKDIDLILIDGRFRVACTLMSIIQCYENRTNVHLMIHDYHLRPNYKLVEKFLDKVDGVNSLFVFKIKDNINLNEVWQCYDNHQYIAD